MMSDNQHCIKINQQRLVEQIGIKIKQHVQPGAFSCLSSSIENSRNMLVSMKDGLADLNLTATAAQ